MKTTRVATQNGDPGLVLKACPKGWKGTAEALQSHPEVDNPYALVNWMAGKGYTPHQKPKKKRKKEAEKSEGGVYIDPRLVEALAKAKKMGWTYRGQKRGGVFDAKQPYREPTGEDSPVVALPSLAQRRKELARRRKAWMTKPEAGQSSTVKAFIDSRLLEFAKAAVAHQDVGRGKLSEATREAIGRVGSSEREEMPSHVFLLPEARKYPVKIKRDDQWVYSLKLLLAAARRARMQGREDLANRADRIRGRLQGGAEKAHAEEDVYKASGPSCSVCANPVDRKRTHAYFSVGGRKRYGCYDCNASGKFDKWIDQQPHEDEAAIAKLGGAGKSLWIDPALTEMVKAIINAG